MAANRSWTAHIAALLGLSSLLGVLCFHFPDLLTSREFRQVYTEGFARGLLLVHDRPWHAHGEDAANILDH